MSSGFAPLRSFVERVERVQSEIDDLNTDKKEIYAEAKGTGFCVKTMKLLIAERRKEPQALAEQSEMLDLYRAAMNGTDSANAHVPAPAHVTHDPDTGEIAETIHMAGLAAGLTKLAMGGDADAQAVIASAKSGPEVMKATAAAILERDAPPTDDDDDLYQRAVTIVVAGQKASASYVQRLLSLGYNKAASLIERMEADGIVSRADVGGRRSVIQQKAVASGAPDIETGTDAAAVESCGSTEGRAPIVSTRKAESNPPAPEVHTYGTEPVIKPGPQVPEKRPSEMPDIPAFLKRATTNAVGRA